MNFNKGTVFIFFLGIFYQSCGDTNIVFPDQIEERRGQGEYRQISNKFFSPHDRREKFYPGYYPSQNFNPPRREKRPFYPRPGQGIVTPTDPQNNWVSPPRENFYPGTIIVQPIPQTYPGAPKNTNRPKPIPQTYPGAPEKPSSNTNDSPKPIPQTYPGAPEKPSSSSSSSSASTSGSSASSSASSAASASGGSVSASASASAASAGNYGSSASSSASSSAASGVPQWLPSNGNGVGSDSINPRMGTANDKNDT